MIKRIDAAGAKAATKLAAQKIADIKAQKDEQEKITKKLWDKQLKIMICAAADGESSTVLERALARGGVLERLGFTISENIPGFKEKDLAHNARADDLLRALLKINLDNFIDSTKHNFEDDVIFEKYMKNAVDSFLVRARRIKDTSDNFALVNYLNSVTYTDLGYDGAWNDFTAPLIRINRLIHMIATNTELPRDPMLRQKEVSLLLPLTCIPKTKIKDNILPVTDARGCFIVAWGTPRKSKDITSSVLTSDRLAWLSSEQGQSLMSYVFGKIEKSADHGQQSVVFKCLGGSASWDLDRLSRIEGITMDHLIEILVAKGYHADYSTDTVKGIRVSW